MNGEPVYKVIAGDLRQRISSGDLAPGDAMPREADLARTYHVARMTVRQALELLESEGLIEGERPRRVAKREPVAVHIARTEDRTHPGESPTPGADSWVSDVRAAGLEPEQQIEVVITEAPPDVAAGLDLEPGTTVIARRLIREAGGHPHNMITFWFPREIATGTALAEPASITEGSVAWLERVEGSLSHAVEVTARMPSPYETKLLEIPQGVPVAVVWRRSMTSTGQPVVTSMAIYPADRTRLLLDL